MTELEQFLNEIGVRAKERPAPPEKVETVRQETNNDWYKNGEECPF